MEILRQAMTFAPVETEANLQEYITNLGTTWTTEQHSGLALISKVGLLPAILALVLN